MSLALALALSAAPPAPAQPAAKPAARVSLLDRIVAVVNSQVITHFDHQRKLRDTIEGLRRQGTPVPAGPELEKQVLERMIMERIQLQFARETGVTVDDLELDRTVARIAETNKMSLAEFRKAFEADGVPFERFRGELRNEILLQKLREREVESRITVAESEIDNLIAEQKESTAAAQEYRLAHILVRVPEQANPEQLDRQRERAEEVVRRSGQGVDFAQLAASYSDAPDALKGGDMGWRAQGQLPDLYTEAAGRMQPGQVSGVLRSSAGFHVLKLMERRSAATPFMVEQNLVRHILARVSDLVSEDEARRKLVPVRERLVNGGDFAALARQFSDDSSAARGGDLGWLYPGDTTLEFERAFRDLKVGEISEPVRTPFGWHLIQVRERRVADVSDERKRLEARMKLRDRKSDESYQEWLRQLRDRAYVEYRLEER